jgi:phosphoribosylglycinamide formyltransferase-1
MSEVGMKDLKMKALGIKNFETKDLETKDLEAKDIKTKNLGLTRLGILGSTRGTNLDAIISAINNHDLSASIEIVISNKINAYILERAKLNGLSTECIDPAGLTRQAFDLLVSEQLKKYKVDLVVLIGYMRILSAEFTAVWKDKIINVHPSLLPAHAGKMDLDVHRSVLAAQEKETGCTVHYVTEDLDAGPIVVQKKCLVLDGDTPESLKQRVQQLEGAALVEAINKILSRWHETRSRVD